MQVAIPSGLTDDNDFIEVLTSMLHNLLVESAPEQLWVIQIDNWFDHKWLGFSGKGVVDFQFPEFMLRFDASLDVFYQDRVTFPPFNPNRVLSQWSFQRSDQGYIEVPLVKLPHDTERRSSNSNLQRRAEDFGRSVLVVWFSGNTLKNGRGSAMIYVIKPPQPVCWFAAFVKNAKWTLQRTKGVSKEYVSGLLRAE